MLSIVRQASTFRSAMILAIASIGYGILIIHILPFWQRMENAEGGPELQARFYAPVEVASTLRSLNAYSSSDALIFYALDIPNAVLFGASLAALMVWGIVLHGGSAQKWVWLLALPLLSGLSDICENVILSGLLLTATYDSALFNGLSSLATAVKLSLGYLSIVIMVALVASGLLRKAWLVFLDWKASA